LTLFGRFIEVKSVSTRQADLHRFAHFAVFDVAGSALFGEVVVEVAEPAAKTAAILTPDTVIRTPLALLSLEEVAGLASQADHLVIPGGTETALGQF
jgi:hypothetical protein